VVFFQSEIFNIRVEALDHFGNFITNANMTMSPREAKQISAIGLKWRMTSSNGSAVFSLALSDENSYSDPDLSFMPQFVFSSQNISVTSNPIVALARLSCMLTFKEQHVSVVFNARLEEQRQHITSCNQVLSIGTLSKFGLDPFCFFSTSFELRIQYGKKASMMPSDTVTFLPAFEVTTLGSKLSAFEHHFEYVVKVPSPILDIIPIVKGSETFGACSPLILDGSASLNSFGRPFTYIAWNLSFEQSKLSGSYSSAYEFEIKTDILRNIEKNAGLNLMIQNWKSQNGSFFEVPAGEYVVMLTLGRWIDAQTSTAAIVLRSDTLVSSSMLLSGPASASVSSAVTFRSVIFRCSNQQPVVYLWSISPVISSATPIKKDGSTLTIPALSLVPGLSYVVVCAARIQSETMISSANFTTDFRAPDVFILGGIYRSFPIDKDIILDGSKSIDVDSPSESLSFFWVCSASTENCPNSSTGLSVSIIRYSPNSFSLSQVIVFRLTARTTRGLSASAEITISFVAANLPRISIERISGKIDVSNVLKLQGLSVGTIPSTWSIQWIDVYQYNTIRADNLIGGSQKIALIFKPNVLPMGRSLRYRIEASGPNSEVVQAEIEIVTNSPPSIGSLLLFKVGGTSCNVASTFNAGAQNFNDFDTPLTYAFSYKTKK